MTQLAGILVSAVTALAQEGQHGDSEQFSAEMPADLAAAGQHAVDQITVGPWWIALIPALPMLGVVLATLCAIFKVKSKLPAWLSVGCLAGSFLLTVAMFLRFGGGDAVVTTAWTWFHLPNAGLKADFHADIGFYVDSLTILWMLFVTGLATMIGLYASEYMAHDVGTGYCRFFAAFNLFVVSMTCLVMADNLILLYLGWEGVGLCSYLLIGYFYKKPSAVAAAKKAFIVNRIGDLGLALGVMLTFVQFGTVEYAALFADEQLAGYIESARAGHYGDIPFLVQLIPVLLMVGAFGKSAQLPLYVWLPDAMEGPTPVSALIHAATMVTAGVFLVARMYMLFVCSSWALPTVAWVGALTAFVAATIGMAQFDIKRIMAYSTISQLGYMFAGLGVLTSVGGAFHVFTHAFFKATLFLCCGAVMHGFAGQLDLRKVSGLWRQPGWKIVTIAMLVGCLNLAGFPFTAGFFSKDMIIAESFVTPGYSAIGWILLITAGLTAYYTFRVFFRVFVGPVHFEPGEEHHGDHDFHPHPPQWAVNTVLATLAVASVLAAGVYFINKADHGWVGSMIHHSSADYASPFAAQAGGHGEAEAHGEAVAHGTFLGQDPHAVMYYVSAVVGILGIAIAWWLHLAGRTEAATSRADKLLPRLGPIPRWAQNKWYVDEFYDFLIRTPLWVLSNIFYLIDKLLVDGLVDLFGWLPRVFARAVRPSQSGVLHQYALGMAGGVGVILFVVWVVTTL